MGTKKPTSTFFGFCYVILMETVRVFFNGFSSGNNIVVCKNRLCKLCILREAAKKLLFSGLPPPLGLSRPLFWVFFLALKKFFLLPVPPHLPLSGRANKK